MPETTPNLDLPLVMPAQAQKHVTVNESLLRLDALVQAQAQSRTLAAQPGDPEDGQGWLIPDAASGDDWAAMAVGSLAIYRDGFWSEMAPKPGWRVHVLDEARDVVFDGSNWILAGADTVLAQSPGGAKTRAILIADSVSGLTGASVVTSVMIPARSIVFCVSVRITEAITGATSFDCGIAGETSKFGGSLGVSEGASNLGVIGPTAFYADTAIVLTANGGSFTGGTVSLAIHAWMPEAPD
ncbi:DUF2793 domain-containing protein [uncultured Maricaulis sp.]|uniref:DUF2793 domain-containing protein n=1 Tax=uncultured Maricaulis sp. TaxID=174710 RepID=UPI0030D95EDF|tara:strand:+ start:54591 stop:55313 length:723 start_codon:yes stop_codon:yes gene_type:complete